MKSTDLTKFLTDTQIIRKVIAVVVLLLTLGHIVGLDADGIALIAIFSGIAGPAATFLFAPTSKQ